LEAALTDVQRAVVARRSGLPAHPTDQAALDLMNTWQQDPVKLTDRW
jgi:hypothetical protein